MGKVRKFLPIIYFLVGYMCLEILYSAVVGVGMRLAGLEDIGDWFAIVLLLGRILVVLGFLQLFRKLSRQQTQPLWPTGGFRANTEKYFTGLVLGAVSIILVIYIRSAAGLVNQFQWLNLGENLDDIGLYFSTTLFVVFIEEIVFRGAFLSLIERLANRTWIAVMITSLIFSLLHAGTGRGIGLLDLVFFFLFSVFLCCLIKITGTVWTGVGFHFGWNFLSSGSGLFTISYSQDLWQQIFWAKVFSLGLMVVLLIGIFFYMRNMSVAKEKLAQMEGSTSEN